MVYCRPASQFCCGCSLEFGVKFVLIFHLVRIVSCISIAAVVIVFRVPGYEHFGGGNQTQLTALSGLAIAGLPLVLAALWGVWNKAEAPLRIYWYYMVVGFIVDEVLVAHQLLLAGPCSHQSGGPAPVGTAIACSVERGMDLVTVATLTGVEAYFIFIVLSHCESLSTVGGGPDFSDLSRPAWEEEQAANLQIYLKTAEANNNGYGSLQAVDFGGLGGSQQIFGKRHEMQYPPHPCFK